MKTTKQRHKTVRIPTEVTEEVRSAIGRALGVATRAGQLPARWQRALALLSDSLGKVRVSDAEWMEIYAFRGDTEDIDR